MKKIILNSDACIGCGACCAVDMEHFAMNEDGYSEVISQTNLESPALQDAIDACPVAIIGLEEVNEAEALMDEKDSTNCETKTCNCENDCQCEKENEGCANPECHCDPCTCEDCQCHDEVKAE